LSSPGNAEKGLLDHHRNYLQKGKRSQKKRAFNSDVTRTTPKNLLRIGKVTWREGRTASKKREPYAKKGADLPKNTGRGLTSSFGRQGNVCSSTESTEILPFHERKNEPEKKEFLEKATSCGKKRMGSRQKRIKILYTRPKELS